MGLTRCYKTTFFTFIIQPEHLKTTMWIALALLYDVSDLPLPFAIGPYQSGFCLISHRLLTSSLA